MARPLVPTVTAFLTLLFAVALLAPGVVADHPGSNMGMARFLENPQVLAGAPAENLVHHLADVDATFAAWEAEYPDLVERVTIGQTSSGFDLLGIVVTDESVPFDGARLATGEKLRVYLDGGHHGNEYLGVELVMYWLEDILERVAEGDAATEAFLATHEIHAVPIINVDGNTADTRKNSNLVDPNRNYPYEWGGPGSGDDPTSFAYRGPEPLSEAETRANAAYGAAISPDLWITMHTGIAEFYWPWGWTHDPSPDDLFFTGLEKPFEEATNGRVDAMQAAELYLAAGATDDFGYGDLGVATFTYEVHEDQFIPVYGQPIPGIIQDQLAGLDFMVDNTQRMGAWLEATVADGELVLENTGWGNAPNVTVRIGDTTHVVAENLSAGGEVAVALADLGIIDGTETLEVTYPALFIESSRVRTVPVDLAAADADVGDIETAPGLGLAIALTALALLGAVLRRKD